MATVLPPPSKRVKREHLQITQRQQPIEPSRSHETEGSFKARFIDADGNQLTHVVEIPIAEASEKNVSLLLNTLLERDREDFVPYRFRIQVENNNNQTNEDGTPYTTTTTAIIDTYPTPAEFLATLRAHGITNPFETTITLAAEPQAIFRVHAVTRMAARIPGHAEAILCAAFSPLSSSRLATGAGDKTARIWDTDTGTPKYTLAGHGGWVLAVSWSPDGALLATGAMDKTVRVWDPETGKEVSKSGGLSGHGKWVTSLAWQPLHSWTDGTPRLASASKDCTVRVWVVNTGRTEHVLSGHRGSVTCVRWGGTGHIYTASIDKTIRIWDAADGTLVSSLAAHAHRVNHLALSTDFVLRTGWFDPHGAQTGAPVPTTDEEKQEVARKRFEKAATIQGAIRERLVSASDDCTMFLWDPAGETGSRPVQRMLGHQKGVNHVTFSPDGSRIASAGFDNHVKLWNGRSVQVLI
jgi:ribosome assembly protein 4